MPNPTVKTTYPYTAYLLIGLLAVFVAIGLNQEYNIIAILFYATFLSGMYYLFLLRAMCRVYISHEYIEIDYLFTKTVIKYIALKTLDYKRSYYNSTLDKAHTQWGVNDFLRFPYDTLIIEYLNEQKQPTRTEIQINTEPGGFKKIVDFLGNELIR